MSGYFPSANLRFAPVPLTKQALEGVSPAAPAKGVRIDSREYKLMLSPAKFAGAPEPIIARFWDRLLKNVIAKRLDQRNNGKLRHKKEFTPGSERQVVFLDTDACSLNANGYLLRERTRMKDGRRELTVKFRTPDIFLAAQSWIAAAGGDVEFEEDIAPLIRRTFARSGKVAIGFAQPPAMRSLFSQSVTRRIEPDLVIGSLRDVTALLPDLGTALRNAGVKKRMFDAPLRSGELIHERVFGGALVDLGDDVDAEFDVTLWYKEGAAKPMIAELSFKYQSHKGMVAAGVARRAMLLFLALQESLGDWANPEQETKTPVALPKSCQD